jgi:hypothetical protein
MSTITDRIGNLEIRDNAVAANAERLPYEVYDHEHPGGANYPVLVATFSNRLDAINYANFVSGEPCFEEDDDDFSDLGDDSMDGDFDSGMASAGFGTDEDYSCYAEPEDMY